MKGHTENAMLLPEIEIIALHIECAHPHLPPKGVCLPDAT